MKSEILTDQEIRRFSKQLQLPEISERGQELLKNANVVVVGAGGLGTSVLKSLAAIGIGKLGIIDYALVDEANIQLQTTYGGNDLGKLKTIITRQHLQELFPLAEFSIINLELNPDNAPKVLQPFHLIVDATNDADAGDFLFKICRDMKTDLLSGAVSGFKGMVTAFRMDQIQTREFPIPAAKRNFLQEFDKISDPGRIAITYGIVGNIMATEVIKLFTFPEKSLDRKILSIDCFSYECKLNKM